MSEGDDTRRVDRIVRECDLYKQTTGILAALAHVLEKQHAAAVGIGRRVRPQVDGGADREFVTPDIMAKRTGKFSYEIKYCKLPGKQLPRTLAKKWARAHPDTTPTGFLGGDRSWR